MKQIALEVTDLTVFYEGKEPVLWDIDLKIPQGVLMAIVGPNGAGKSTLLKAMLDLIPKAAGETFIFGKAYKNAKLQVGYVPQKNTIDWDFPVTVYDVVLMGAYGRMKPFYRSKKHEKSKALHCLKQVNLLPYKNRQINELSGGQQQRTFLARALMQEASITLMDEPFAGVDIQTEKAIAVLFKTMQAEGKTLIVVHHDITTLREYFDTLAFLNKKIIAYGPMQQTFTEKNLKATYTGAMNLPYKGSVS